MYFVYILKSINFKKSYAGSTSDVTRRLSEHNSGKSSYTKKYRPWKIVYTEEYNTLLEARLREKFFKTKKGRQFLKETVFSS